MKQEILVEMIEKAKSKEDGIYSHKNIIYAVRSSQVKAVAPYGTIYQHMHGFLVKIGEYDYPDDARKLLKKYLKDF